MIDKFLYRFFGWLDIMCEYLAKQLESKSKKKKK